MFSSTTLSTLTTRLTQRVGDNTTFWLAAEKRDAINEALCVWQAATGDWTTSYVVPVTSGVFYDVPRQVVSVQRIKYGTLPLTATSEAALDMLNPGWESETGTPELWAPLGLNMVALYPAPTSGTLTFEGLADAPVLRNSGDYIDVGEDGLTELLAYAHHYLTFKEGGLEFQATTEELAGLLEAAGERNSMLAGSAKFREFMGRWLDKGHRPESAGEPRLGAR